MCLGGSSGASYLWADNSVSGTASATFAVNTTGNTGITINFNEIRQSGSTEVLSVITSTDNFVTSSTTVVSGEPIADDVTWQAVNAITLPAFFDNQTSVQVKFQYTGNNSGISIGIDDVRITGTAGTVYYWKGVGALHTLASWGSNTDGSGAALSISPLLVNFSYCK